MRLRRVIWNPWKIMGSLEAWRIKALKHFCHKQVWNARGSKENPAMKHSWWQSLQPLLEHFLKSKLCMLYVIWKLRKSTIQCFKPCAIWSWNEEVTAFGRQLLQAEGRIQKSAAESAFCCGMISQHFCTVLWISPEASRRDGSQTPQDGSPLCKGVESAGCYEEISQPFLCTCEISQTSLFTCEMVLSASRYL